MRDQLISNISYILNKPLTKEGVVYLMVEIRKLINRDGLTREVIGNLKYWCDWTVHTELDREFAIRTLSRMEQFITQEPEKKFHESDFNSEFVSIENLRWSLHTFLSTYSLPTETTNIPPWRDFASLLVETLRDCPLKKSDGLVREFAFITKEHIPEARKHSIDYEIRFDDSRRNFVGSVLRFEKRNR